MKHYSPTTGQQSPYIVEFVGVAGSGKSTLSQALSDQSSCIHRCLHPNTRSVGDIPFYIKNIAKLWGSLSQAREGLEGKSRREIAWMAVLRGWVEYLRRKYPTDHILILDQGPIYLTAELHHFDPMELKASVATPWWNEIFNTWSGALDLVVWLDAADETLQQRIQSRMKHHGFVDRPDTEVHALLNQHRSQLEKVIPLFMGANGKPRLLSINTGEHTIADITTRLTAEFHR